jgi:hypothetical protein
MHRVDQSCKTPLNCSFDFQMITSTGWTSGTWRERRSGFGPQLGSARRLDVAHQNMYPRLARRDCREQRLDRRSSGRHSPLCVQTSGRIVHMPRDDGGGLFPHPRILVLFGTETLPTAEMQALALCSQSFRPASSRSINSYPEVVAMALEPFLAGSSPVSALSTKHRIDKSGPRCPADSNGVDGEIPPRGGPARLPTHWG